MSRARLWTLPAAGLALATLAACASQSSGDDALAEPVTASAGDPFAPASAETRATAERADPLVRANFWAGEYAKDPSDLETALKFGDALRGIGSHERAVQIAADTAVLHPASAGVYLLMGRALGSEGQHERALGALVRAASLDPEDADIQAALGLAYDRLGQHASAQLAYRRALEMEPGRAATRSNYGLSLALSGELDRAETELRRAADLPGASSFVRQNLALVLGLQGRFDEMRSVSADAPEDVLRTNTELLKRLRGIEAGAGVDPGEAEPVPAAAPEMSPVNAAPSVDVEETALSDELDGAATPPARPMLRGSRRTAG